MATTPACALCSGQSATAARKGTYQYWRCTDCGFVFLWPVPSEQVLTTYYNKNYRKASYTYYPKARSRAWRASWKSLRFLPLVMKKRTLDIGCGGGFMTHAFSRLGAHASGLDISEASIAYAKRRFPGATFYCENFEDFTSRRLEFDFVFSSELLEHLPSPWPFMTLLQSVSHKGTHVYISCPDAGHSAVPDLLTDWTELQPPEHIQFFNRSNIMRLFEDHGFILKRAWTKRSPAHSLLFVKT